MRLARFTPRDWIIGAELYLLFPCATVKTCPTEKLTKLPVPLSVAG